MTAEEKEFLQSLTEEHANNIFRQAHQEKRDTGVAFNETAAWKQYKTVKEMFIIAHQEGFWLSLDNLKFCYATNKWKKPSWWGWRR